MKLLVSITELGLPVIDEIDPAGVCGIINNM